jgi:hypothetical protein
MKKITLFIFSAVATATGINGQLKIMHPTTQPVTLKTSNRLIAKLPKAPILEVRTYCFKREFAGTPISNLKPQVDIGKFEHNCIVVLSHELPPDWYYLFARPSGSISLTSYRR